MKLVDKEKVVEEIKKRIQEIDEIGTYLSPKGVLTNLLCHLNTLETKEVDLDYIKKELDELIRIYKPNGNFGYGTLYNIATHFFELGIKSKGE